MAYQDLVAEQLMRPGEEEMHRLMAEYEVIAPAAAWSNFTRCEETKSFLRSHHWTLLEYADACFKCSTEVRSRDPIKRHFAKLIYD